MARRPIGGFVDAFMARPSRLPSLSTGERLGEEELVARLQAQAVSSSKAAPWALRQLQQRGYDTSDIEAYLAAEPGKPRGALVAPLERIAALRARAQEVYEAPVRKMEMEREAERRRMAEEEARRAEEARQQRQLEQIEKARAAIQPFIEELTPEQVSRFWANPTPENADRILREYGERRALLEREKAAQEQQEEARRRLQGALAQMEGALLPGEKLAAEVHPAPTFGAALLRGAAARQARTEALEALRKEREAAAQQRQEEREQERQEAEQARAAAEEARKAEARKREYLERIEKGLPGFLLSKNVRTVEEAVNALKSSPTWSGFMKDLAQKWGIDEASSILESMIYRALGR